MGTQKKTAGKTATENGNGVTERPNQIKIEAGGKCMEQIEIDFPSYKGLDFEPEDRSVGIFGNAYILCFEKDNKQISIALDDDAMVKLYEELKHYAREDKEYENS